MIMLLIGVIAFIYSAWPELRYQNSGKSISHGTVGNGELENAFLMPYSGANFRYFSPLSYYVMNNGYLNNRVHNTVLEAYNTCESTCPNTNFVIMECSDRFGAKLLMHNTHQNGTSIDFALPKLRHGHQFKWLDWLGVWHYLLDFKENGRLRMAPSVEIDFETMARHILALDEAGKKYGVRVKKVILKIELKDDFFKTKSGKEVKSRGIYFARILPDLINNAHEDHYHVDFKLR
jgi:penicillin-insensitive murein DD-endopeptidase